MDYLPHEPGQENRPDKNDQHASDTASTQSSTDVPGDKERVVNMEGEVEEMVRQLTRYSSRFSAHGSNPFFEEGETTWNPDSPNFKVKDWIRALVAAQSRDPERFRPRTAGVAFKNLYVHGFGSPTDYQKDVFNSVLSLGGLARRIVGSGLQKIQILDDLSGVVRSGEMLLVLGRPGRQVKSTK